MLCLEIYHWYSRTASWSIDEMIKALDKVTPGIASDETLLYGVEVKFYSNKVVVNDKFETNIKNLRVMGDGASITRGLQQASANGICVALPAYLVMKIAAGKIKKIEPVMYVLVAVCLLYFYSII